MVYRLIFFIFLFKGVFAQAAFLPATEDIPLMNGIILTETSDFSFDTPAGQILTLEGESDRNAVDIQTFYRETLTAMGWVQKATDFYVRGSDTLQLSFSQKNKVRFDILLSNN